MSYKKLSFPVARLGRICKADRELTDEKSLRVAREIQANADRFLAQIYKRLERGAVGLHRSREDTLLDVDDTPTVSFPYYDVLAGDYSFRCRPSLTVCQYSRRSKIWSTVSLREFRGSPASELSPGQIGVFFDFATSVSEKVTTAMFREYTIILQQLGIASEMKERYALYLRGANSSDSMLRRLLREFSENEALSFKDAMQENDYRKMLLRMLGSSPGRIAVSVGRNSVGKPPITSISLLRGAKSGSSLLSIVIANMLTSRTSLDCICYSSRQRFGNDLPAHLATKELLTSYAGRF